MGAARGQIVGRGQLGPNWRNMSQMGWRKDGAGGNNGGGIPDRGWGLRQSMGFQSDTGF